MVCKVEIVQNERLTGVRGGCDILDRITAGERFVVGYL
jgi:hypothetical protein